MNDRSIEIDAKFYEVPVHFLVSIKRGEWGAVRGYAQHRWNKDGYALLKKYRKAVDRVLQVFIEEKNYPDSNLVTISTEQEKKIAYYIHHLGIEAIIDDIRKACRENKRIRTINYFLTSEGGKKTGRWGMMYFDKMNVEWQKQKEAELNCHAGKKFDIVKKVKQQWQIDAEKRLKELEDEGVLKSLEIAEAMTLNDRIIRHGIRETSE